MRLAIGLVLTVITTPGWAQESALGADFRREGTHLKENCGALKKVLNCAITIATEPPIHLALGTIAPKNGVGFGAAFVVDRNPSENWRVSWNADAVGAIGGAWRAGTYLKLVSTRVEPIRVIRSPSSPPASPSLEIRPYPIINGYVQATSLAKVFFFGLGPGSTRAGKAAFRLREAIVGADVIVPVVWLPAIRRLNASLRGEVNGRFVGVRDGITSDAPPIGSLYSEATAPGLTRQPTFLQLGEGLRVKPALFNGGLRLNYLVQLQQFIAISDATYSFRRWTVDFGHDIPLYHTSGPPASRETNGPDECATTPSNTGCPSVSRNRTGVISARFLVSKSSVSAGAVVPFYFQPTVGGSDLEGNRLLASYEDYRFRGPHLIALQESVEHSIFRWPVGLWLAAEQAKVALEGSDLDFRGLERSFAVGLTLRAGGFPFVLVSYGFGGHEGNHFAATVSTSLLGGSSRPSLH
jgi:hypothetical protein